MPLVFAFCELKSAISRFLFGAADSRFWTQKPVACPNWRMSRNLQIEEDVFR
jgi:hypothetical protein